MDIIIGTTNKGKVREIAAILMPLGYRLIPKSQNVDETGISIEGNAIIKAKAYSEAYPGLTAIAEDSGLVVPELNNLPGIYSSRFHTLEIDGNLNVVNAVREIYTTDKTALDIANNARLLEMITRLPAAKRGAYLEVCFAIAKDGEILRRETAKSYGFITDTPKGSNGFGYDPLFVGADTFGKTYAELDNARKNLRSHRKKALQKLGLWMSVNLPLS